MAHKQFDKVMLNTRVQRLLWSQFLYIWQQKSSFNTYITISMKIDAHSCQPSINLLRVLQAMLLTAKLRKCAMDLIFNNRLTWVRIQLPTVVLSWQPRASLASSRRLAIIKRPPFPTSPSSSSSSHSSSWDHHRKAEFRTFSQVFWVPAIDNILFFPKLLSCLRITQELFLLCHTRPLAQPVSYIFLSLIRGDSIF